MSNDGGPFRGQREHNVDYFDDIMGDNSAPAIFDGGVAKQGGIRNYDGIQEKTTAAGVEVMMHCRACNLENKISIPWTELYIVAHAPQSGLLPQGWRRSDVNMAPYPETFCPCRTLCAPIVQPDWAARKVDSALRAGLITHQGLMSDPAVMALAQRMAQQGG